MSIDGTTTTTSISESPEEQLGGEDCRSSGKVKEEAMLPPALLPPLEEGRALPLLCRWRDRCEYARLGACRLGHGGYSTQQQ